MASDVQQDSSGNLTDHGSSTAQQASASGEARIDPNDLDAVQALLDRVDAQIAKDKANISDQYLTYSKRNPHMLKGSDLADRLDRDLAMNKHRIWGWVIYRCTYENDEEWQEVLQAIHFHVRRRLVEFNALDLLETFELTVMDDKAKFAQATTAQLREHFRDWAKSAPVREQGCGPAHSQRYLYFLRVQEENLFKILQESRSEYSETAGRPPRAGIDLIDAYHDQQSPPESPEDDDNELRFIIDGTRDYRVGWVRFHYRSFLFIYNLFREEWVWELHYERPPKLVYS